MEGGGGDAEGSGDVTKGPTLGAEVAGEVEVKRDPGSTYSRDQLN